ncbi:MAG: MFS transporter [Pseudolysinimonas sp.]
MTAPADVRRGAIAVFVIFALNGVAVATWISRLPTVRDILGLDVSQVGILIAGLSVGSIFGLFAASPIVHRFGARLTIVGTLVVGSLGIGGMTIATSVLPVYAFAIGSMAVFGFAWSMCDVAMNVEGTVVERASGRTLMPWFHASWSLGSVLGAGIGAAAAFGGIVPSIHFAAIGVLLLVAALFFPRLMPAKIGSNAEGSVEGAVEPKPTFREQLGVWKEPRTLLIGVLVLGMAFAEGSANDWLTIAMVDDRGLDAGQGALLFGVFSVAMTIGRIAGVPLLDRFGRVPVLRVSVLAAALGLGAVILLPSIPVTVVAIVIWGLGAALGFPVGMSAAGDDPSRAAARVSAVATIAYCAFLVGPPIIGFVGHQIGILNALWIVFGLIVIAGLAVPAARERVARG